jgi:hypothetical protein
VQVTYRQDLVDLVGVVAVVVIFQGHPICWEHRVFLDRASPEATEQVIVVHRRIDMQEAEAEAPLQQEPQAQLVLSNKAAPVVPDITPAY